MKKFEVPQAEQHELMTLVESTKEAIVVSASGKGPATMTVDQSAS